MARAYIYNMTDTWNVGGTTFTAVKMNVTDTASAAGSALMDLQVGGVSQFKVSKAGAVTAVGVEIPTISSTSTLTNKTLSSPTLSGTVAGTPTFSGNTLINAVLRLRRADTTIIDYQKADGSLAYRIGRSVAQDDAQNFYMYDAISGDNVYTIASDRGIVVGSPTGGSQGAGTINATAVYDDGVLLTCYVLEHWLNGSIDLDAWDARVPNREIPAIVIDGEETEPARIEVRQHLPARGFATVADARLDIDQFRQFLADNSRLPAFPGPERWADMFNGKMATGDVLQRLWETVEILAVHACKARERELALEARITALENT